MARTVTVPSSISGQSSTKIVLFPLGSDTATETITSVTEATNRDGWYTGTVDAGTAAGRYDCFLRDSSDNGIGYARRWIGSGAVDHDSEPMDSPLVLLETVIATVTAQDDLQLAGNITGDGTLQDVQCLIFDQTDPDQYCHAVISDSFATNNRITLTAEADFVVTAGDKVVVLGISASSAVDNDAIATAVIQKTITGQSNGTLAKVLETAEAAVSSGTHGNAALKGLIDTIDGLADTLVARLTQPRADKLDYLTGPVATAAGLSSITQAQRVKIVVPSQLQRPTTGTTDYRIWIYAYDEANQANDLDSLPTITAENNAAVDRSSNLGTVTKPGSTTGIYYVDYSVADSHASEGLVFKVDATEDAVTTQYPASSLLASALSEDFTATDRTNLETAVNKINTLHDTRLTESRTNALENIDIGEDVAGVSDVDISTILGGVISVSHVPAGEFVGFPLELVQGDAYTVVNGRHIKNYFKDADDNFLIDFGDKSPADLDFTYALRFFRMPVPKNESDWDADVEVTGDHTDWDVTDPAKPFLLIELPAAKTAALTIADGALDQEYLVQLVLFWGGVPDHELTPTKRTEIKVVRKFLTPAS